MAKVRRARDIALALLAFALLGGAAPAAVAQSFTAPVRLGFEAGDDWEPAIAADRFGHV